MGWSLGYDSWWERDIGYGVPAQCDKPGCTEQIDRGLAYVCGNEPYGGENGCGRYYCYDDLGGEDENGVWECEHEEDGNYISADVEEWTNFKLTDDSWAQWRLDNGIGN